MTQVQPKHPYDARYTLSGMSVPVQATVLNAGPRHVEPMSVLTPSSEALVSGRV